MKRISLMLVTVLCVLLLAAAGGNAENADPWDVVKTILNDPQVIFWEDAGMMNDNGGANFGDVAEKRLSEDGESYEFVSGDDGAYMIGNVNFLDEGTFRGNAQAIWFRFKSENPDGLSFTLHGPGEIMLGFENGQPRFTHVQDQYSALYSQYRETTLTVQPNDWYWAVMAIDSNGYYRSIVWANDNTDDVAYVGENIGDWHNEYRDSNWHLTIALGPNQLLAIQEYSVMDFAGFTDVEYQDGSNNQPDYSDPMEAVNEIVTEPRVLYQDDPSTLPDRGYTEYSDVANKNPGDGFEFYTDGNCDGFTFKSNLNDIVPEGERKNNLSQGVLLMFKSNNPTGLQFNLTAGNTVFITFMNGGEPFFGILENTELGMIPFDEQTGFTLESDKWYYAILAVDIQSNFRFKVWEYGNAGNSTYYQTKLVEFCGSDEERAKLQEQKWTFGVHMGNDAQFHIMDFRVFDFDEIKVTTD